MSGVVRLESAFASSHTAPGSLPANNVSSRVSVLCSQAYRTLSPSEVAAFTTTVSRRPHSPFSYHVCPEMTREAPPAAALRLALLPDLHSGDALSCLAAVSTGNLFKKIDLNVLPTVAPASASCCHLGTK